MGRPVKEGLDYMQLDCGFWDHKKARLFRAMFPKGQRLSASMLLVLVWMRIYAGKGYYIEWDEDERLLCCEDYDVELEFLDRVIECAVERGLFDRSRLAEKGVLTSEEITVRWANSKDKRFSGGLCTDIGIVPGFTGVVHGTIDIGQWISAQRREEKRNGENDSPRDNSDKPKHTQKRPKCPKCGREIIGDFCDNPDCLYSPSEGEAS